MDINVKISNAKNLHKILIMYIRNMNKFTFNNKTLDNLKSIDKILNTEDLKTSKLNELGVHELFKLWNQIQYIEYLFKLILTDLEDTNIAYEKQFVDTISNKELSEVNDLYSNVIVYNNKYKKTSIELDEKLINEMYLVVKKSLKWESADSIKASVDIVTDFVIKYIYSVSLYTFIMQETIKDCLTSAKGVCDYILDKVEIVKNVVILHDKKIESGHRQLFQSNAHLKTFGLTVHEESSDLSVIFKKYLPSDANLKTLQNLAKDARSTNGHLKKADVCVVIINRVIKKPIEFNLWSLIDQKIASPYLQSSDMGITQKTIDQFNTIQFKELKSVKKWDFSIDKYGSIDSEYFIVLENLNNELYRVMCIYNEMYVNNKNGGGRKEVKIHKDKITEFINYVKNKGVLPTKTRISEYNLIQEKKVLANMFLPIKFDINEIKLKTQIIESHLLRHFILSKLQKQFDDIFKKEFKNGDGIKTYKNIAELIHNKRFIDIFDSVLIEQYDIYAIKNKNNNNDFKFSETMSTFLAVLFSMNTDFRRLIHDFYIGAHIDVKILSATNKIKHDGLFDIFTEIVEKVLGKIISNERNIYQELLYKNDLLNLSLY